MRFIKKSSFLLLVLFTCSFGLPASGQEVITEGIGLLDRIGPGEKLPVQISLSNFGSNSRVDVQISYEIRSPEDEIVYVKNETVAVETSAQFVRFLELPDKLPDGLYVIHTNIQYPGQQYPATASFQFSIEKKIASFFLRDVLIFIAISLIAATSFGFLFRYLARRHLHKEHLNLTNYSHIPKNKRIYYQIIGDTLQKMRLSYGDAVLEAIAEVQGLKVSPEGRILTLRRDPADVLAELVGIFEKKFSSKVHFGFLGGKKGRSFISPKD